MKIRSITLGIPGIPDSRTISWAGQTLAVAAEFLSSAGYSVQTRRISFGHWYSGNLGFLTTQDRLDLLRVINDLLVASNIDLCSIGISFSPSQIEEMGELLASLPRLSGCADAGSHERGLDLGAIAASARTIKYLSDNTDRGIGNFRFCAGFFLEPGIPYFPSSYHQDGAPSFALCLENSDLLNSAFREAKEFLYARESLRKHLEPIYISLEENAVKLSESIGVKFGGIDTSLAPSLKPEDSIVLAFDALGIKFGKSGTLAVCGAVTDVLKAIPVRKTGYCGIMLPLLEDVGLAEAARKGAFGITDLLSYSSVCGVGLDVIPISGYVRPEQLEALMLDAGTMAMKLKKPLSVRLLPIPGKKAGEPTAFDSDYLCNGEIMDL